MSQEQRKEAYQAFLISCRHRETPVKDLIHLGQKLMRQESLYHHFFADHSLYAVAKHLAFFSLGLSQEETHNPDLNRILCEKEAQQIIELYERRISERLPVAYLTQEANYLGRRFYVNDQVLVPRSLMNTRFDEFLARITWKNDRVLDLCTGSGCIGITLALMKPELRVDLADISEEALKVAAINIERFDLKQRVTCIKSNLFDRIQGKYDLIITNPPYVSDREYEAQPPEIKREPALALRGGVEGLDFANRILVEAKHYLNPKGLLIMEVGYEGARRLKWRYPNAFLEGFCYKKPGKKGNPSLLNRLQRLCDWPFESLGLMDGVLLCKKENLPEVISQKNALLKSWIFRTYRFLQGILREKI